MIQGTTYKPPQILVIQKHDIGHSVHSHELFKFRLPGKPVIVRIWANDNDYDISSDALETVKLLLRESSETVYLAPEIM